MTAEAVPENHSYAGVIEQTAAKLSIRVPRSEVANTTSRLLGDMNVLDLSIEDPPIEEVIERVFATPKSGA